MADRRSLHNGYCGALLLPMFYSIRSERMLMEPMD
jgi:hypothetical protein